MTLALNPTSERLVTPPAEPAVSVEDFKTHARIDYADDDAYIADLLACAERSLEAWTRRQFITATREIAFDAFPSGSREPIRIPKPPLKTLVSFTYLDDDGAAVDWLANVKIDATGDDTAGRIQPIIDEIWPTPANTINAVVIQYTAGTAAADLDPRIRQAILILATNLYGCGRGSFVVGQTVNEIPDGMDDIINSLMIRDIV